MNFPVGEVIAKANLPVNFETVFNELQRLNFNGYIIQTVRGNCIEEGAIFFREGQLNACVIECLKAEKVFKGEEAFPYFLNQTRGKGFFQTIQLTRSQVDLVIAFDEKMLLKNKIVLKELPKLIPDSFKEKFELPESTENILEKYGLSVLKK
jgi:hypothetical protein